MPVYPLHQDIWTQQLHKPQTWTSADSKCLGEGGRLASVHSEEEDEFFLSLIRLWLCWRCIWYGHWRKYFVQKGLWMVHIFLYWRYWVLLGISEKCTGAFKFGCRIIFWSIYLSKDAAKVVSSVYLSIEFKKMKFILCFNFITNIKYV